MQMPDHAGHEISGLKVAEISSRKGRGKGGDQGRQRRHRGRAGSAAGLMRWREEPATCHFRYSFLPGNFGRILD
jgi:hypothetical protein